MKTAHGEMPVSFVIDAAGEKGHVRGVDIFKLKDGLICEKLSYVKG